MKRMLTILLAFCLMLAACGQNVPDPGSSGPSEPAGSHPPERLPPYIRTEPEADWGIDLRLQDAAPTGGRLVCTQTGGTVTGELNTGSYFRIEEWVDGEWVPLPVEIENLAWTMEAWSVPLEDTTSWDINWEWVYGELPIGEYRIAKEFMDFRETGNYDKAEFFAYFIIL